jgi:hypothetical protein
MDQEQFWREIKLLPPQAQREVIDFIAFLRRRYQPTSPGDKSRKKISEETFVGMWANRDDLADSSSWVRNIRKSEWSTH